MSTNGTEDRRCEALGQTGLSARADVNMERFAGLVARTLRAPVALVSLVEHDRQVFPGAVGLTGPWAEHRQSPVTHSLCRHVVADGKPLVLADARLDDRVSATPAVAELGVVAYAGMPLTDGDGHVLGSLCAIDTTPRRWSRAELTDLADLAAACSSELRLRLASRAAEDARAAAEAARATAQANAALLLRASQEMADAASVQDVRQRLRHLVTGTLTPHYVGLSLLRDGRLIRVPDPDAPYEIEEAYGHYDIEAPYPSARALRDRRMIAIPDREVLAAEYSAEAVAAFDSLGLASAVCLPLVASRGPVGVLMVGWDRHHQPDLVEQATLNALASYTAHTMARALFLGERITVARQLQSAMLTDLPATPGLDSAALYRPAATDDMVGGDWYDSFPLPAVPDRPGESSLAITVGDITGHDIRAAALMGQVRSMLRQAVLDHPALGPAAALTALEHACLSLRLPATGSILHARLAHGDSGWALTWSNAGHPPPLLLLPDRRTLRLDQHDVLFYPGLGHPPRTDHRMDLAPGSTLLLYTDGLVDRPGRDVERAIGTTRELLATHGDRPLSELLETLADELAGPKADDDIALLAVRVPPSPHD
ncbi:GAF domain-containing SpoIIE family protein phosphatase [Streptosporangium saharense]|uniref:Serine phosphatase RsbU (Regulator of sigma subunit) n=1 Tax=Streptosporangium saharense TaxID=1706840 RepID=A0A7W7QHA4_9ACTN|nr:SpoIIE family protein phosphatase [Streptosporangium saharense]MBB4913622.1 serine phosphatase RsbU (regulator of sigma subunit) [Streptosporangium saharense]